MGCRSSEGATAGLSSSVVPGKCALHCWTSQQWHPFQNTFLEIIEPAWVAAIDAIDIQPLTSVIMPLRIEIIGTDTDGRRIACLR